MNDTKIETAILEVQVPGTSFKYEKDGVYDLKYHWRLKGKNTTSKPLTCIYFRVAADNSVESLDDLEMKVNQIVKSEYGKIDYLDFPHI